MNENLSTRDLIDRLVKQSGIKKKLAVDLLRVLPEIIEEGLIKDGEVRVKDLGTFRMKWTQARPGRNPKTGETVEIPPHNRLVFLPEQSFKEFVNRDNRLLSYKVIPAMEEGGSSQSAVGGQQSAVDGQQSVVGGQQSAVGSQQSAVGGQEPEKWNLEHGTGNTEHEDEKPEEIDYSYEPEMPVRSRRHIHWIIPVVLGVVAVLCVVFYFRNFNPVFKKSEDRRQKAYIVTKDSVGSQQSAVSGQQSAVSGQQSAVSSQQSAVSSQQSAVGSLQSADTTTQNSEPKTPTQNSTLKTQNSEGKHLFQIAREAYGNPFLWVLIYKENLDKIPNPDVVISGKELVIPELEGKPRKLSHNDSVNVADGYRMVYEFYLDKGNPKAEEFRLAYERYKP
jgi:nucleoid DNA-binding protein